MSYDRRLGRTVWTNSGYMMDCPAGDGRELDLSQRRFHQTLKRWLTRQPAAANPAELQHQLDTFLTYYNKKRPHRALNRRTPAAAYTNRPKATPGPITTNGHFRVRHDRVDTNGKLTLRHHSRLHHIGIGRAHSGTPITMLIHELNIRIINTRTGQLIRQLTLDPTRDYQPQK